jgi:hypothetical protein
MTDAFAQLGSISAVLGGFAFTFLGVLLSRADTRAVVDWTCGVVIASASCFTLCALGWSASAVWIAQGIAGGGAAAGGAESGPVSGIHGPLSLLFVLGVFLFLTSLGLSGWVRSRRLGVASTVLAVAALLLAVALLHPFVNTG